MKRLLKILGTSDCCEPIKYCAGFDGRSGRSHYVIEIRR